MKATISFKLTGIRFDRVAFDTMRTSEGAQRAVEELAVQVAAAANARYAPTVRDGGDDRTPYVVDKPTPNTIRRARRTVFTNDWRANYINARELTLLNALGDVEGRGAL